MFILDDVVWVVEHRRSVNVVGKNGADKGIDSTVMHIASSKEKALAWMRANRDVDKHSPRWWWALYPERLDSGCIAEGAKELEYYKPKPMRRVKSQPM